MTKLKTVTLKPTKTGQKPIKFKTGGLHKSLGIKTKNKISAKAMERALSGKAGKLAKKQANFAKNVLTDKK